MSKVNQKEKIVSSKISLKIILRALYNNLSLVDVVVVVVVVVVVAVGASHNILSRVVPAVVAVVVDVVGVSFHYVFLFPNLFLPHQIFVADAQLSISP